ncbi:MAG TPA: methyltransferase domain-containing protein [Dehalococcoidia bacterium]|nr:methyltransferase domain-containing protein [Dehalococcoidia bacterium]
MRSLRNLALIVLAGYLLATYGVYIWLRERHGRGGPIPVSQAGTLLHPLRSWLQPVRPTLDKFGLRGGDTVLEVGPGPGYFTMAAASMVGPAGRVVCLDVQRGMLERLRARLDERAVANAQPLLADATRLPLADRSVDAAFLVAVLGEVPDRPAALRELRRVLKPGGTLSFTETLTDPDYVLQGTLRDLCRAVGFEELACSREVTGYTMTFVAP